MSNKSSKRGGNDPRLMKLAMLLVLAIVIVAGLFYFFDITPEDIDGAVGTLLGTPETTSAPVPEETETPPSGEPATPKPEATETPQTAQEGKIAVGDVTPAAGKLTFVVIDVGQGDSIFIQTPSGKTMLIDCGEADAYESIDEYLQSAKVERIDVLVATHPHSDHIGGMRKVVENYEIGQVWMPKTTHTTKTYEKLLEAIAEKGLKVKTAKADKSIELDPNVTVRVLAPVVEAHDEVNDDSAVLRVDYMNSSFLVTGDIEAQAEGEILEATPELVNVDVLKVAHHGSSSSSTAAFLDAATPDIALISCGDQNSYNHPNQSTVDSLNKRGIAFYRTDYCGTIAIVTDGKELTLTAEKESSK